MDSKFALNTLALAMAGFLTGCGAGGGGSPLDPETPTPLTVLPTSPTVFYGNPTVLTITGGKAPYKVFTSDGFTLPVTTNISGSQFAISPNNVGANTAVTLQVLDAAGTVVNATVTVKPAPLNNSFKITPDPAAPGVGCGTAVCTGMTALVEVKLTNVSGAPITGRTVRFENASSTGVVGGGGDYFFIDQIGNPTPVSTQTTAVTDENGVAYARIKATSGKPTQYALIKMTDQETNTFLNGNFTIAQYTDGTGTLSVLPTTATITDSGTQDGYCASGAQINYHIFGGTPPYNINSTFPNSVLLRDEGGGNVDSNNNTALVSHNGAAFTAITTNTCVDPLTFAITDATGRTISATLFNKDGSSTPVTEEPAADLVVSPTSGSGNVGQSLTFAIAGGTAPYTATSANTAIAQVDPATVTASGTFTVRLNGPGTTTVAVRDSTGKLVEVAITVNATSGGTGTSPVIAPNAIAISECTTDVPFIVTGGRSPFITYSTNSVAVPTTTPVNVGTTGSPLWVFTVSTTYEAGVRALPATTDYTITVLDQDSRAATATVGVTNTHSSACPVNPKLTLAPTSLTLTAGSPTATVTIQGAAPGFSASSSDTAVATVSAVTGPTPSNAYVFTVTRVAVGTIIVRVQAGDGQNAFIPVYVQ